MDLACDANCADPGQNGWKAAGQGPSRRVSSGLDLALDAVYNLDGNIFPASCDADCAFPNARWQDTKVELTSEMKAGRVIPCPNCPVAAWFLRHPSIALSPNGQALDASGGVVNPDPIKPPGSPGDMPSGRLPLLP